MGDTDPCAHRPPPAPGSRHLQLVDSDHLEGLPLGPLRRGPQKLDQLRGKGDGPGGVWLHRDWISSQQGSQAIQVSQVLPHDLQDGQPRSQPLAAPASLQASEARVFARLATVPGRRSSVPALD